MYKMNIVYVIIISIVMCILYNMYKKRNKNKFCVGLACMMKAPKDIDYWLNYHIKKGVDYFYIRLEDTPELHEYFAKYPNVKLEIGSSRDPIKTPKTYDTQVERQREYLTRAIEWSIDKGIDWLIHIDSDELVDCEGNIKGAIKEEVRKNRNIGTIIMDNYEAQYDKINKANDFCFVSKKFIKCSEGGCASYANGKSIGKVSRHLHELGVHRFGTSNNSKEIISSLLRVLHFESCDFKQYVNKFLRLASTESMEYPFKFYNDSLSVARSDACKVNDQDCMKKFEEVYTKYKIAH